MRGRSSSSNSGGHLPQQQRVLWRILAEAQTRDPTSPTRARTHTRAVRAVCVREENRMGRNMTYLLNAMYVESSEVITF